MRPRLLFDGRLCTGCRLCEEVCRAGGRPVAVIHIAGEARRGTVDIQGCRQCVQCRCADVCAHEALGARGEGGGPLFDPERCIGCQKCVLQCPLGAVRVDPAGDRPVFCDLCGGEPRCASVCPSGAIQYVDPDVWVARRRWEVVAGRIATTDDMDDVNDGSDGPRP